MLRKSKPFSGSYLFHFHTTLTDGSLSINEYFAQARTREVSQIIFLEHIRRNPTYDVAAFIREIECCESLFGIPAVIGFEAKILPDGMLDICDEHAELAQVIGIAEHGFTGETQALASSFEAIIHSYRRRFPNAVLVWAHPGLWLKRHRSEEANSTFEWMLQVAVRNNVLLERNLKYGLISSSHATTFAPEMVVTGLDAHGITDFDRG